VLLLIERCLVGFSTGKAVSKKEYMGYWSVRSTSNHIHRSVSRIYSFLSEGEGMYSYLNYRIGLSLGED